MVTVGGNLLEAIWQQLLRMFLPSEPAVLLLEIDPKEIHGIGYKGGEKKVQPQHPTTEWLNKLPHILMTLKKYIYADAVIEKRLEKNSEMFTGVMFWCWDYQ